MERVQEIIQETCALRGRASGRQPLWIQSLQEFIAACTPGITWSSAALTPREQSTS